MVVVFGQCKMGNKSGVQSIGEKAAFKTLSEYQFFTGNIADLQPNEGVAPYDLNSPLFTDYAEKLRFVWMPKGRGAEYATVHVLNFPVGAVLIKNFFYHHDERDLTKGRRIIETRLLVNRSNGWEALNYVWNDEQTEAFLNQIGDIKEVSWTTAEGKAMKINYIIPNRNQCKGCHSYKNKFNPIGPKVANLNKNYAYPEGEMNQLEKWASLGYLHGFDPGIDHPKVAQWDDPDSGTLQERAMSYLDINCAHCHNPDGPAHTSGLTLTADQELNMELGIYKAPVATGRGSGGHAYSIVPGQPENSILVYRLKSTDPGAMMPELGRSLVHEEGVALVADWIKSMEEVEKEPGKIF